MADTAIYRRNDNLIEWLWLIRNSDGAYLVAGTVSFSLYKGYTLSPTTGDRLPSTSTVNVLVRGPVAMSYVTGSNGRYQGKLAADADLEVGDEYTIEINATATGHVARRSIPVTVIDRTT